MDDPFIARAIYIYGLFRQVDIAYLVRGAVPPDDALAAGIVQLVQRGIIIPCRVEFLFHRQALHTAGGSIHDVTPFGGVVLVHIFKAVQLYYVVPGGHATGLSALQLDLRQLLLRGGVAVGFYQVKRIGVGGFIVFLVHAVQAGVGIKPVRCAAQLARSANRRDGRFLGGLGGLFGFRGRLALGAIRPLRPAGGEGQGQDQQAGDGFFHRVFSFRVCIYLLVYISIGV